VMCCNN